MNKILPTAPCFVCNKELQYEHMSKENPASRCFLYDGLWFDATGNFGSTIYDPIMGNDFLRIAICDKCVMKKKKQVKHIHSRTSKHSSKIETFAEYDERERQELSKFSKLAQEQIKKQAKSTT
jgi:hypothetical protein